MTQRSKKLIVLTLVIAVAAAVHLSGLTHYLTFENLKEHREELRTLVHGNYGLSVVLFIITYVIVTGLSLPGATVLTLGAGFLFGAVMATLFAAIGATLGAVCAFLLTRYLLGNWVHKKYESQLQRFNAEIEKNGRYYLLTVRLIPAFPFFLINLLAGMTRIPLSTFFWTTAIGIIPGDFVYSFAGSQLGKIDSLSGIFSLNILLVFLLLAALSLIPALVNLVRGQNRKT